MDRPIHSAERDGDSAFAHSGKILCLLSLAAMMLCAYQWKELVAVGRGEATPLCSISETINCAAVWKSPLSVAIHTHTGIPVAGWGLAWGAVVFLFAVALLAQINRKHPVGVIVRALQLTSATAVAVCVLLLAYSIGIAVFCPTCLAFYIFAGVTTYMTMRMPAGSDSNWFRAAGLSLAALVPVVALILTISLYISRDSFAETATSAQTATAADSALARFLESQPKDLQQYLSNVLAEYRNTAPDNRAVDAKRVTWGNKDAPVHLVEWIELRCSHCRDLHKNLDQLTELAPPDTWNIETRFFPLDSECNPSVQRSPGNGVSCLAAKLLICLAGEPQERALRAAMFQNQPQLTPALIWELADANGVKRDKLQSCVDAPGTAKTLKTDIELALQHGIEGTPLVVINGRRTVALPHLIMALIMSQGRADDPAFRVLPPPEPKTVNGEQLPQASRATAP